MHVINNLCSSTSSELLSSASDMKPTEEIPFLANSPLKQDRALASRKLSRAESEEECDEMQECTSPENVSDQDPMQLESVAHTQIEMHPSSPPTSATSPSSSFKNQSKVLKIFLPRNTYPTPKLSQSITRKFQLISSSRAYVFRKSSLTNSTTSPSTHTPTKPIWTNNAKPTLSHNNNTATPPPTATSPSSSFIYNRSPFSSFPSPKTSRTRQIPNGNRPRSYARIGKAIQL